MNGWRMVLRGAYSPAVAAGQSFPPRVRGVCVGLCDDIVVYAGRGCCPVEAAKGSQCVLGDCGVVVKVARVLLL